MVEWDWGEHERPASVGPGVDGWTPIFSDRSDDVPSVAALIADGYVPAPEAPLWCFIPAVWPSSARAWVRDQRVRHLTRQYEGEDLKELPWSAADYADSENVVNSLLAELGLPARPAGRIWLLRAPKSHPTAHELLNEIWSGWQASGGRAMATVEFVEHAQNWLRKSF